ARMRPLSALAPSRGCRPRERASKEIPRVSVAPRTTGRKCRGRSPPRSGSPHHAACIALPYTDAGAASGAGGRRRMGTVYRLEHVGIGAQRDKYEETVRFYETVFGWRRTREQPGILTFVGDDAGGRFEIFATDKAPLRAPHH